MKCTAADLARFLREVADEIKAKGIEKHSVVWEWTRDMLTTSGPQKYKDTGVRHLILSFELLGYHNYDDILERFVAPVGRGNPALYYPLQPVAISASDVRARIAELEAEREA